MKRKEAKGTLTRITVRIPEPIAQRLKLKAVRERTSVQELAREAFEDLLKKQREEGRE
jgi:predicted HicB family RNase H-like nuclease